MPSTLISLVPGGRPSTTPTCCWAPGPPPPFAVTVDCASMGLGSGLQIDQHHCIATVERQFDCLLIADNRPNLCRSRVDRCCVSLDVDDSACSRDGKKNIRMLGISDLQLDAVHLTRSESWSAYRELVVA